MEDENVKAFKELTGSDVATAERMLAASNGDLERALALHFDVAGDEQMPSAPDEDEEEEETAPPALPGSGPTDMVAAILRNAKHEDREDSESSRKPWQGTGSGRTLGASSSEDAPAESPEAPSPLDRHNAKKVRIIFWADGLTVEDVTAEEEAAAKAELDEKSAPRRTGVVGLKSSRDQAPPPVPKIPELRKYEANKQFMEDLTKGIPPAEFRELDMSSGVPRPRPVDIMLADLRPREFPGEALKRMMMPQMSAMPKPAAKPAVRAFSGQGHTLSGAPAGEASTSSGGGSGGALMGAWPSSERAPPAVDASAPTTTLQVRLTGGSPQRFTLNTSHTVADLRCLVERALAAAGEGPRGYVLATGFPPKQLTDSTATLEAAGLLNAAVTHRWA